MSMQMWQMLNQQPSARTDAEVAANIMRMFALGPMMREDISRERDIRYAEALRAQGVEPGSEAFARQFQAKRKIEIPYTAFRSGEQFATEFPEHYTGIASQIENVAAPHLARASPEVRDRAMKAIMGMVRGGQFPVHYDPTTKKFIVDSQRAAQALQAILPTVIEMASKMPQTETFGTYLARTNPALAKIMDGNAVLKAHGALPVDVREPQRAMGPFLSDLRSHADSILQGTQLAVAAVKADPSPTTLAAAVSAVAGVEELVRQGVIPAAAAKGLLATAQAYRNQAMDVRMPDGRRVSMPANEAQQFVNQRAAFFAKQAEVLGQAMAQRPGDAVLRQQKNALLSQATKEGLDTYALPVFQAIYGREQLDLRKARLELVVTGQQLANEKQEYVARGLQIDQSRLTLAAVQEKDRLWKKALADGNVNTWTPGQRAFMGLPDVLDLDTWAKFQGQHGNAYKLATEAMPKVQDRTSAQAVFAEVLNLYRLDRSVNDMGRGGQQTTDPARISTLRNLSIAQERLIPQAVRYYQKGWISQNRAREFLTEVYSDLTLAIEHGLFGDPSTPRVRQGTMGYLQTILRAEQAIGQPVTTPSFWNWLRSTYRLSAVGLPVPRRPE